MTLKSLLTTSTLVAATSLGAAQAQEADTNANTALLNLAFTASSHARGIIDDVLNDKIFNNVFPRISFLPATRTPEEKISKCKLANGPGKILFQLPYQTEEQRGVILSSPLSPSFHLMDRLDAAANCANEALVAYQQFGKAEYIEQETERLESRSAQVCVDGGEFIPRNFEDVGTCITHFQGAVNEIPNEYDSRIADFEYYQVLVNGYKTTLAAAGISADIK